MAFDGVALVQSTAEVRTYTVDFTGDLPSGETVSTASVSHTPQSGSAVVMSVAVSTPNVSVQVGPLSVIGDHLVTITAALSNGDISEFRLHIPVIS